MSTTSSSAAGRSARTTRRRIRPAAAVLGLITLVLGVVTGIGPADAAIVQPAMVSGVVATPSTTSVALTWTNPSDTTVTGLSIRRIVGLKVPPAGGVGTPIATLTPDQTSYTDTTAAEGTQYSYAVFTTNAKGTVSLPATVVTTTLTTGGPGPVVEPDSSVVTADALPTVQINGVAWTQVVVGNTVYVGGDFSQARPAGSPAGQNTTGRMNVLAYDITTGNLLSTFNYLVNGAVKSMAVSPDQTRLYIGGNFTSINFQGHNHVAAFDLTNNAALISSFTGGVNGTVNALTATNSTVYAGGSFNAASDGTARMRLAAFDTSGALTTWAPTADNDVQAMVLTPDQSKVVVGGHLQHLNDKVVFGIGAVSAVDGTSQAWATNRTIHDWGQGSAILSLTTDGTSVFGTGYKYQTTTGWLEGAFSADGSTGKVNYIENCLGDTYGVYAAQNVIYTVSHSHFCGDIGGWSKPQNPKHRHTMAFTKYATGITQHNNAVSNRHDFYGTPAASIVNWFPDFAIGTYTGQNQAAWTVTGNSTYVVEGGEFPSVGGVAQQGLVRFAVPGTGTQTTGPKLTGANFTPTVVTSSIAATTLTLSIKANYDLDDSRLTYSIVRDGTTVGTITADSEFWNQPILKFTDRRLTAGTTYSYTVVASDPHGNSVTSPAVSVTTAAG